MLQSYPISDLVQWMKEKTLVLNPRVPAQEHLA